MKRAIVAGFIITMAIPSYAEMAPDYVGKVGRWQIAGSFLAGGGTSCSAMVDTKELGKIVVGMLDLGSGNRQYSLEVGDAVVVVSQEKAEGILENPYIYKDGKRVAKTGGSWEVVQEMNRCIEAAMLRDGGE